MTDAPRHRALHPRIRADIRRCCWCHRRGRPVPPEHTSDSSVMTAPRPDAGFRAGAVGKQLCSFVFHIPLATFLILEYMIRCSWDSSAGLRTAALHCTSAAEYSCGSRCRRISRRNDPMPLLRLRTFSYRPADRRHLCSRRFSVQLAYPRPRIESSSSFLFLRARLRPAGAFLHPV